MEKFVRKYRAQRADGVAVEILEYQEFIDVTSASDKSRQWAPGMRRLELRDGGPVNAIDDKTFEIVGTGERVTIS